MASDIDSDIRLHGTWISADKPGFFFWGESRPKHSNPKQISKHSQKGKRKGRSKKTLRMHPFCASGNELMNAFKSTDLGLSRYTKELIAILPSSRNLPEASSEPVKGKKTLSRWKVPCMGFSAHEALIWLALLPADGSMSSAYDQFNPKSFGEDILFWSSAAKFGI